MGGCHNCSTGPPHRLSAGRHKTEKGQPIATAALPPQPSPEVERHAPLLRAGAWFRLLPPELQAGLLAAAQVRRLEVGQRLFARGDPPDGLYAIASGGLRMSSVSADGKEAVLALAEPPQWFGEIALFDGQPRTHDVWAESRSVLLHVPQAELLRLLQAQPAWWQDFGLLLAQKLRLAFSAMEEAALLPPAGRLARRLVAMAGSYGSAENPRRELQLPQETLGLMLSLSRQTVNQLLKQFEAEGAIRLGRGSIEIVDLERLRVLAG